MRGFPVPEGAMGLDVVEGGRGRQLVGVGIPLYRQANVALPEMNGPPFTL